jgi:G3E family GTPase
MAASSVTPVTLLTGFLGSGKTTLLNALLRHPDCANTAVLINEYGDVAIDHLLVREASETMMVMSNGCICCSVAGDMVQALRDLYFKRANGEVPPFTRVIIETTGLADPAPILHTLIQMPLVAARYSFSGVITTVDATHAEEQLNTQFEAIKQIALADRIIITKTDIATPEAVAALRERITALNPGATIFMANHGDIDPTLLLDTGLFQANDKPVDARKWMRSENFREVSLNQPHKFLPPQTMTSRHDARIVSFSIIESQPLDWDIFCDAIELIVSLQGDYILRMKGIVHVVNEARPRAIHVVQHTIYPSAALPSWPDDDKRTKLVFILRDANEQLIRDTLRNMLSTPT